MHHTAQEIQDFVNDASRNFSKIRATAPHNLPNITYNEKSMSGSPHKIVAHNALPIRTYPIELPMGWLD